MWYLGCGAVDRCQARGCSVIHAEPEDACLALASLSAEPETGLLGRCCTLVAVLYVVYLPIHWSPAVWAVVTACSQVGSHIHRGTLVVVTHSVENDLWRDLLTWLNPQRHTVFGVVAHSVVGIGVHTVSNGAEEAPYTSLATTQCAEVGRCVGVAEAELLVATRVETLLASEGDYILGVEAVLRIVERECRDTSLVGVCAYVAVRNAACNPYDTLA